MSLRHPREAVALARPAADRRRVADRRGESAAVTYVAPLLRAVGVATWAPARSSRGAGAGAAPGERPARLLRLLDDAASLDGAEIERLAACAQRARRTRGYAEALLAIRRAADCSGRARAVATAGSEAEHLIASAGRAARGRVVSDLESRARWSVVVEQASWGAGDAARALVVSDLIAGSELRELTSAWEAAQVELPAARIPERASRS